MASLAEQQPVKKRKLYELSTEPSPVGTVSRPVVLFPLSQEEVIRRRRNKEEIRKLYECYKRIKFFVSRKDPRLMADFEQAYLSLITASRGCTSVQRIVAELIPRYAAFCPTALEAAAKVSINMYNWSLAILKRGEDLDGAAYQTAKACIFGLVDICCTASYEAPTSSVIRGICAAVFQNVLTFFISYFEGKGIYDIGSREILKLQEPIENFYALKQERENDYESSLNKLFKYGALCLLRIFFSFPKNLLAACFELITTSGADANNKQGNYFLDQVTSPLKAGILSQSLNKNNDGAPLSMNYEVLDKATCVPGDIANESEPCSSENCFMGMVLNREPSLKGWILARYKKLADSLIAHDTLEISSFLEKVLGPVQDFAKGITYEPSDEENIDSSNHMHHYARYTKAIENASDLSRRDHPLESQDNSLAKAPGVDSITFKSSIRNLVTHKSVHLSGADVVTANQVLDCEGERAIPAKNLERSSFIDSRLGKPSISLGLISNLFAPAVSRNLSGCRTDASTVESLVKADDKHESNVGHVFSSSISGFGSSYSIPSLKQILNAQHLTSDYLNRYTDADPSAMDVFSATKLLWLGSLGYHASESSVRQKFENFGHLEQFLFVPEKNFALVEYRNLIDAVKARELMQGSSQWGGFLKIKFIDLGLGSRGIVNGVAVGDSCHVYVGKVMTQWSKEEILNGLIRKGARNPLMVTDLTSEGALLLEFGTADEAAAVIVLIRHLRNETKYCMPSNNFIYPKDKLRDIGASLHHEECHSSAGSAKVAGYFSSHGDPQTSYGEPIARIPYSNYSTAKPECFMHELASPRVKVEKSATASLKVHELQPNWGVKGIVDTVDVGSRNAEEFGNIISLNLSSSESLSSSHIADPVWPYKNPESGAQPLAHGIIQYSHSVSVIPPPIHSSLSIHPIYPPNNTWDNPSNSSSFMLSQDRRHFSSHTPLPFIPSSITPLSQIATGSIQRFEQIVNAPNIPTPLPSSPPPLPPSQPPSIPPPPTSPPPISQSIHETIKYHFVRPPVQHQWQGTLSKSGVHYCTLYATREDSHTCKYISAASEPAEWPTRLDVTKRTDYRHVMATFGNTPLHRREVCRLLPSTASDHKGLNDFISYLKQRECAGVIKIPAVKSMWARLLFILPYSLDFCSLLGIAGHPVECLIALVLPKDSNLDSV